MKSPKASKLREQQNINKITDIHLMLHFDKEKTDSIFIIKTIHQLYNCSEL
jgi:hypothetical protein